ncbi:hypothetical protein NUU61_000062 [Penicillium alfredii]|uniref:Uncharacterized protein n=1 Tax=Penicillium alfredii TaxID=1506179 RepID=A0A9W9G9G2_9EURO|nr:uncharacterized protein NUU61_000062 [Penicillium alfredii]KAJ5114303.1 hypothetical protein NUU61_000062 [Penicillium alfredii]
MLVSWSIVLVLALTGLGDALPPASSRSSQPKPHTTPATRPTVYSKVPVSSITSKPSTKYASVSQSATSSASSASVGFAASGDWLAVSCDVHNNSYPFAEQWKKADGDEAWNQTMAGWRTYLQDPNVVQKSFDAWLWNALGAGDQPRCFDTDTNGCNPQGCVAKYTPAGNLMMDNLSGINQFIHTVEKSISDAKQTVQGMIGAFVETFTALPSKVNEQIFKTILDALTFGVTIASAVAWNVLIKQAKWFKVDDWRGASKDVFSGSVAFSMTAPKDNMKSIDPYQQTKDLLSAFAEQFMDATSESVADYLKETMWAKNQSAQEQLSSIVTDGLGYDLRSLPATSSDLQGAINQLFFARILGQAWKLSTVAMNPFILRVDRSKYKCGDPVSVPSKKTDQTGFNLGKWMNSETAAKTQWCDPQGNAWFLLNGKYTGGITDGESDYDVIVGDVQQVFGTLAGGDIDTLNGKDWAGITIEAIIKSSWGAFLANGNKNGYQMIESSSLQLSTEFDKVEDGGLPFIAGIETPGFFNLTICFDPYEAVENLIYRKSPICGESPKQDGYMSKAPNSAGYTSGACTIHVTEYQPNHPDLNLLDQYQLAVTVFDDAKQQLAYATKQPVDPAIKILDKTSKLPYDLVISTDRDDHKSVCFWYADQWWCDSDAAHECNFGQYDGGKREGDCKFTCNDPGDKAGPPPVAPPGNVVDANLGTNATGDGITLAKTYSAGKCDVMVRQYQANEMSNDLNPSNDHALELTLWDAKGDLIAYTVKTTAPPKTWVNVQGPLPYIVQCANGDGDGEMSCQYADQSWTTNKNWKNGERYDYWHFACA